LYYIFVGRAGNYNQITAIDTGSIKEIPDDLVVFKGDHNVKYLGATRTDVDWS